jgi:uncharacterized protein (TIGR01777 family)
MPAANKNMNGIPKLIAMTGASGFIGKALSGLFKEHGWQTIGLDRKDFSTGAAALAAKMQGSDVVVNLAGTPVLNRWTEEYKRLMRESRVTLTARLIEALNLMSPRPALLISTSAIGYYAAGGPHDEDKHKKADDFLGQLASDWEREALRAEDLGLRVVVFRFGIVIGRSGGALAQMLGPFRLGLGGTIGDGSQPFSWIHIDDLKSAYLAAIQNGYSGIYNLTAPNPTTNTGLTSALSHALGKTAPFRVPSFAIKLRYGEGAGVLTSGQAVIPKRLIEKGFRFRYETIEQAVKDSV